MPIYSDFNYWLIWGIILLNSCNGSSGNSILQEPSTMIAKELSNQQITSFAEDKFSYIWIGTNRGLNKFNGYEFYQYFHSSFDTLSICNNQINTLYVDQDSSLWIGTQKGISRYNPRYDYFESVPIISQNKEILEIKGTKDGQIFANAHDAVYRYDKEKNVFTQALNFDSPNINNRFQIGVNDHLWLSSRSSIKNYDNKDLALLKTFSIEKEPNLFFSGKLDQENIWVVHGKGNLRTINTKDGTERTDFQTIQNHPILSKALITNTFQLDDSSSLIVTHKNGVFIVNEANNTIIHEIEQEFPFPIPNSEITSIFKDSRGNLWFGTHEQGIFQVFKYKNQFNTHRLLTLLAKDKSVKVVRTDYLNRVWIYTYSDQLITYDPESEITNIIDLKTFFPEDPYYQDKILDITITEKYIWLLSVGKVIKCSYHNSQLIREKNFFLNTLLKEITKDNAGNIWITTDREFVVCINESTNSLSNITLFPPGIDYGSTLLCLADGMILVAANNQPLKLISPSEKISKDIYLFNDENDNIHLSPTVLYEDSDGDIWIGRLDENLLKYNPSTEELIEINTTKDIVSIIESEDGELWLGSLWGLHNYKKKNQALHSYYAYDGIGGNQFNIKSACKLSSGDLIFGGTHGLTTFNPRGISLQRKVPLYFEDLKVNNKSVKPGKEIAENLKSADQINLDYNQNVFSISYAAVDYAEFSRLRYYYMLDGIDDQWIDAKNNRVAHYSRIKPGRYTFKVKATSNDSNGIESENSIQIVISQPPWFTIWARLLYLAISLSSGYYIYKLYSRIRTNKMQALMAIRDKEREAIVNQMNMSFFSNISHEFRTPLTLISGPVNSLYNSSNLNGTEKSMLELIQRNIKRMLRLVNQLMDLSKLESDTLKLKVSRVDIIDQINSILDLYRISAKEKNICLKTKGLEDSYFMMMDTDKLEKIMTNILSNAFKYTPETGTISLNFDVVSKEELTPKFSALESAYEGFYALIEISDTGPGIPEDKLEDIFKRYYQIDDKLNANYNWGTGIGLYFTRRLVEIHHGLVKASNNVQGGSTFSFIIPTSRDAYTDNEILGKQAAATIDISVTQKPYNDEVKKQDADIEEKKSLSAHQTILVVDDDIEIAFYIKKILRPYYTVITKYDGTSAWNALSDIEADLIISDVLMPGMNGYELCQMIKNSIDYCHIPIILLTAKTLVEEQIEGLKTGANAYVTKPFEPDYLIALIKSQLRNKELLSRILISNTNTGNVEENILSPKDKALMTQLYELMETELANPEINITAIAEKMKMSRTKFYHKIKGLTGEKPNVFFKQYKLNKAAELLIKGQHNVSEIAEMTGFGNLSHFSISFKKQFNCNPSEYKG